jgi:hypothetical protein
MGMDNNRPPLRLVENTPWNDPRSYAPNLYDSIDVRTRQLQLDIHPRIGWLQLSFCALVAAFIGACLAVTF